MIIKNVSEIKGRVNKFEGKKEKILFLKNFLKWEEKDYIFKIEHFAHFGLFFIRNFCCLTKEN